MHGRKTERDGHRNRHKENVKKAKETDIKIDRGRQRRRESDRQREVREADR